MRESHLSRSGQRYLEDGASGPRLKHVSMSGAQITTYIAQSNDGYRLHLTDQHSPRWMSLAGRAFAALNDLHSALPLSPSAHIPSADRTEELTRL